MADLHNALSRLLEYVESERFSGYDPYDALNSSFNFSRFGKWGPILAIQFQKRNPINVRSYIGIEKGINPKALGLMLYAYSQLYELERKEDHLQHAQHLFMLIRKCMSKGYSGACWGYNFDWASPKKYLKAYVPSVVVTSFVARGLFKYYLLTQDEKALALLLSACDFVLDDLKRTQTDDGICFSYTPEAVDCCYNASLLGAELLARAFALTNETHLRSAALQAVDFVIAHQHDDGHWKYSINLENGKERHQVDFHQGFILDSIRDIIRFTREKNPVYQDALVTGASFYKRSQFHESGQSMWRLPRVWPVDIHHQAQGIVTFSKLASLDSSYYSFSEQIANWTVEHMQDEKGFFYYRKGRLWTNKIPYMRWAQAWMMVAFAQLFSVEITATSA